MCNTLEKFIENVLKKESVTESQNIQLVSLISLFDCSALGILLGQWIICL